MTGASINAPSDRLFPFAPAPRSQASHKQSGGRGGSFQNLIFEGHALGVILRKPGFRSILIGEDLDVLGVANLSG
jgi:hypothetical protein